MGTIYKLNIISIVTKLVSVSIILIFLIYFIDENMNFEVYVFSFFIILIVEVFVFFFGKFLIKIEIKKDTHSICLYFKKYFVNHLKMIPLNELSFSFKRETGARGVQSNEFRFYDSKGGKIIGIGRGFDGWEKKNIDKLIEELKELKVKELL
ncbi:hypothetical protein [Flavobacterium humi]|uniref:Uncharacterized protein n=1 Tax=Flavobacterium humi TaxID=2562683 RepID=A0A4Z0LDE8_9FLAO|nr:hypothetical protein [Flavobacterium humi]TGD59896.1 hypothetical protein E4635_02900 [Flavobacterium humi]